VIDSKMITFFSLLALLCLGFLIAVAVFSVWRLVTGRLPAPVAEIRAGIGQAALWMAFAVAATTTFGSLWLSEVEKLLLEGTNDFRKAEKRGGLKSNKQLAAAARAFAEFMASNDKFGHEADGREPSARVKEQGYDFCAMSENIAYQYSSRGFATDDLAAKLLEGWKDSPGHRKNMLDADVLEAGMGVAHSKTSGKYYAVQLFGRPKSAAIKFEVVNKAGSDCSYELDGEKYDLPERVTRTHTLCLPGTLTFAWQQKDGKPEPFRPVSGDTFVVTKEGDQLKVTRKEAEE